VSQRNKSRESEEENRRDEKKELNRKEDLGNRFHLTGGLLNMCMVKNIVRKGLLTLPLL